MFCKIQKQNTNCKVAIFKCVENLKPGKYFAAMNDRCLRIRLRYCNEIKYEHEQIEFYKRHTVLLVVVFFWMHFLLTSCARNTPSTPRIPGRTLYQVQ